MKSIQSTQNGAIAVEGAIKAKAQTGCHGLAGSDQQDRRVPPEHWNVAALFVCSAFTPLIVHGNVCNENK